MKLLVEVVEASLPLLISLKTQKLGNAILDTTTDTVILVGCRIELKRTKSGHYAVDLLEKRENVWWPNILLKRQIGGRF